MYRKISHVLLNSLIVIVPYRVVSDTSDTPDLGDEYSNSSRLHLAGGMDHPNYSKVPQFPDTDGGSSGNTNTLRARF